MKIELKNIGTVKQAEIDLDKNLLIFCGPNNSGKTYVAYALYGAYTIPRYGTDDILIYFPMVVNKNEIMSAIAPESIRSNLKGRSWITSDDLGNLFASNQNFFSKSEIAINLTDEEIKKRVNDLINDDKYQIESVRGVEINKQSGTSIISIEGFEHKNEPDDFTLNIKLLITDLFLGNAYIAPAERIAINIFSKELSLKRSGLLDPFSKDEKSRYSLPITACLRIAEDLQQLSRSTSEYSSLAELFEKQILKGSISISQYGAMQFNPYDTNISELDIHLSGSMVKSLSSLVFYFRHLANKGDFIIIDEPELNLHPDNQIIMARILARIVNEGFKVLISTHSDYIITEINNLIRLNSAGEGAKSLIDKYGYKQADLIDKDMVGVYLFKDNKAIDIPVDEFGFEISTIQKENSRLAEISESIYFDLFDKEN